MGSALTRTRWPRAGGDACSAASLGRLSVGVAVSGGGQATPPTKQQGGGVSFWKRLSQSYRPPSPKGGAEGGTHTCLSYARNVVPQVRTGGGAFRGQRLGKGPDQQSQEEPAGPRETPRKAGPSRAGDRCAESSRCPSGPRQGGGRGGPGRTRPPPWLLWALQGVKCARDK